jgi:phosphoglycolate phosphatase
MTAPLIVFDLDGTLLDTAPDLLGALNVVLGEEGLPPLERHAVRYNFGHGARALIVEGLRLAGRAVAVERLEAMTLRFLDVYAGRMAVETRPYPGAEAALDRLAAQGFTLAVCTNKREALARPLLATLGLADRFAAIVGGDSLPVRKPHPDHLLGTIAAAGGRPETSVMVGDSDADAAAARGAGVPVIGVSFGYTEDIAGAMAPDATIDHFDDLDAALAGLSPRFAAPAAAARAVRA